VVFGRPPDPLDPPVPESGRRYYLRIYGGGLVLCVVGIVAGIVLQRAHYRGQAGLILSIVSGMLGLVCAEGLVSHRTRGRS
jgi:hypothetical protein